MNKIRGMETGEVRLPLTVSVLLIRSDVSRLFSRCFAFFAVNLFILHGVGALHAGRALAGTVGGQVLESPYVFTTEKAALRVPMAIGKVKCKIRTLTATGWGPTKEETLSAAGGRLEVTPLAEGIHIVAVEGVPTEYRFLAIEPPPPLTDFVGLVTALPRTGRKLLVGDKYTIVSMNDTETDASDYQIILGMLLKRVTGNAKITFEDRSFFGRTVDTAVRRFQDDVLPKKPDLGLLMYGRADQAQFAPLDGYVAACRTIAERLAKECNADTVFLQPTPDIDVPVEAAARTPGSHPPEFALRTLAFAEALRPLAADLGVGVADSFRAIWGRGGKSMEESVRAMWPLFPPGSHQQMRSLLETSGKGDTLYPNALGNLAIARAALRAICGQKELPALHVAGYSEWVGGAIVAHVRVRNISGVRRIGHVEVYPLPDDTLAVVPPSPIPYNIAHTESIDFDVTWPKVEKPEDLTKYPAIRYVAPGTPQIPVVDFYGEGSCPYLATCPLDPFVAFVRERLVAEGNKATLKIQCKKETADWQVAIPVDSLVGRSPALCRMMDRGNALWAAGELAWVRYGAALKGEAEIDGKLDEWAAHAWVPVGEPCQARSPRGVEDYRASKGECYLKWAFKAAQRGVVLAFDATGKLDKDQFTLLFDTRPPQRLGTPGRTYWVHGVLGTWGKIGFDLGDTSPPAPIAAAWKTQGDRVTGEMLIPYGVLESKDWPSSGDLGLSIGWAHTGPDGKVTNLSWSDDGYPWSPRWFGVVRLTDKPGAPMPCTVRVK